MNIWFVTIFENTPIDDNRNTRYNSLVREALNRGHEVTFWACTFRHNVKKQRYDKDTTVTPEERLTIRFILSNPYSKNISLKRLLSHRKYAGKLVDAFDKTGEKPDLIMMAFPPISIAEKVSDWAQKQGIPCVADVIDPWPEVFSEHIRFLPSLFFMPMKRSVKKTMNRITAVTAISNQYIEWARGYNPGIEKARCFYPAVQFRQMQEELAVAAKNVAKNQDLFTVVYAGSLGYSYDISCILEAAAELEKTHSDSIRFIVAGDGPHKDKVEAYQNNHSNLEYVGRIPKEKLMEYYFVSSLGCIQHIKGATQSVTYKLFDLLACGLPILNSLESEMRDIIVENEVGLHNEPGDAAQLVKNILFCFNDRDTLKKMQKNAVELTKKSGDSELVYRDAIDFLEKLKIQHR